MAAAKNQVDRGFRGRPRIPDPKVTVTLRIKPETLAHFKSKSSKPSAMMGRALDQFAHEHCPHTAVMPELLQKKAGGHVKTQRASVRNKEIA